MCCLKGIVLLIALVTISGLLFLIIAKAITEGPSHGADRASAPALICPAVRGLAVAVFND